jgi:hypothetical protein
VVLEAAKEQFDLRQQAYDKVQDIASECETVRREMLRLKSENA